MRARTVQPNIYGEQSTILDVKYAQVLRALSMQTCVQYLQGTVKCALKLHVLCTLYITYEVQILLQNLML